jgi:hypothetical protein
MTSVEIRLLSARAAPLVLAILTAACDEVRASPSEAGGPLERVSAVAAAPPPAVAAAPPSAVTAAPVKPLQGDPLRAIAQKQASLREAFSNARGDAARDAIRIEAARYIERALIDDVLPRWDGTPWAFEGTSKTPGQGSIACGYFVTTTLQEAGIHVERAKLAQQPSEDIIKSLVPASAIARFSDVPVEKFTAAVAARGDGLYVVGLDIHVGFLIVRGGEVLFHHSSYVDAAKVVREKAAISGPLVGSRYRVIGKLFTDDALIDAWLLGAPVATKTRAKARATR